MRRQQADETRQRITAAARKLMIEKGFDGTTMDAIAAEAGVAAQTVYTAFGSKVGIVAELLNQARFGPRHFDAVRQVLESNDPEDRLRAVARIARQIFESERAEMDLLRGAGAVAPELAVMEREHECERFDRQAPLGEALAASGRLRRGVSMEAARDMIWTLTGRESFRMLVVERGWTPARFETWLGDTLIATVLEEPRPTSRKKVRRPTK